MSTLYLKLFLFKINRTYISYKLQVTGITTHFTYLIINGKVNNYKIQNNNV